MRLTVLTILGLALSLLCLGAPPSREQPKHRTQIPSAKHVRPKPMLQSASGQTKSIRSPRSLVLLYTSSAEGQIRSCNCTKFRFGGYGRELTLLEQIRSKAPNTVLVEGGDVCGDAGFQAELKAKVSNKALEMLGYAAMVPGENELGARGVRYADAFKSGATPLVCANLSHSDSEKTRFRPYVIQRTAEGLRIALIGLMDGSLCQPWLQTSYGESVQPPSEVLPAIIKQVRPKADLVVLIYHGVVAPNDYLASVKGIDLILTTHKHTQERLFPGKDSNVVTAPVAKLGGAVLIDSATSTNWCLGRVDLTLNKSGKIESAMHSLTYLDRGFDEAPAMVRIYEQYNEEVKNAVIASSAAFKKEAESMLTKRGLNLVQMRQRLRKSPYATSAKCVDCHPEISSIYAGSQHAHAMATLEKTNQQYDPECIRCHTTGATTRGGFTNAKDTPELANVQCEACHGGALSHVAAPAKGYGQVTEETCRSCHTDERTPDFDFAAAWAKIMH